MKIDIYKYTNKGPRSENQDSLGYKRFDQSFIACIADGVGGANGGKFASQYSVDKFLKTVSNFNDSLNPVVESIHKSIVELQKKDEQYSRMATTFTGCLIYQEKIKGVHLGDSRLCILRRNGIKQLTINHTEVNRLLRAGKLTKEEAINYPRKNVLESAIGIKDIITIQNFEFDLENKDRILITTDGVHDVISKVEFRDLSKKNKSINDFGDNLVSILQQKKITDNLTFLIIELNK
ncbi:serine/threonine-protein phosphatase [Marinilabiliaceae bacterium JC017]|nr:serine/threonine-protein phosphatase [Marinilabiliaceae bacterium JC017]